MISRPDPESPKRSVEIRFLSCFWDLLGTPYQGPSIYTLDSRPFTPKRVIIFDLNCSGLLGPHELLQSILGDSHPPAPEDLGVEEEVSQPTPGLCGPRRRTVPRPGWVGRSSVSLGGQTCERMSWQAFGDLWRLDDAPVLVGGFFARSSGNSLQVFVALGEAAWLYTETSSFLKKAAPARSVNHSPHQKSIH